MDVSLFVVVSKQMNNKEDFFSKGEFRAYYCFIILLTPGWVELSFSYFFTNKLLEPFFKQI